MKRRTNGTYHNEAIYLALYSDGLTIKIWANYRSASGEVKEGIYKAIVALVDADIVQVLRLVMHKLEILKAKYLFIYSNDQWLNFLTPLRPVTEQHFCIVHNLTRYIARNGGWDFFLVEPEAIKKAKELQPC